MKKVSKITIHDKYIEIEVDCPDCPQNKRHKVAKPDVDNDESLKRILQEKYPWAKIT